MQYFKRLAVDRNVGPVLDEIAGYSSAWAAQTGRQRIRVQAEANTIPLRGLRRSQIMGRRRRDVHESRFTSLADRFPETVSMLQGFAKELDGSPGRAKIALLPPAAQVLPHSDRGLYYKTRDRYHFVLHSRDGSLLRAGDEEVRMQTGELWWFDNKAIHSATNDSEHSRIHLIFDLLPNQEEPRATADGESPNPRMLLQTTRTQSFDRAADAIQSAVELYLAICRTPTRWQQVLIENDLATRAETKPLAVIAELLWPDVGRARRRRRESAIAWSLAQLDLDAITPDRVSRAITEAGGIKAIDRAWREDREALLYGGGSGVTACRP